MNEQVLTSKEKEAIRTYMLRLVALPGIAVTIIVFLIGFFFNQVVRDKVYQDEQEKVDQIVQEMRTKEAETTTLRNNTQSRADEVARHAQDVETSRGKVHRIVDDMEASARQASSQKNTIDGVVGQVRSLRDNIRSTAGDVDAIAREMETHAREAISHKNNINTQLTEATEDVRRAETARNNLQDIARHAASLRDQIADAAVPTQAEKFAEKVSTNILLRDNFWKEVREHFNGEVSRLESQIKSIQIETDQCSWVEVGYNKAHKHDGHNWCPNGLIMTELDLDSCGSGTDCPVIGRVECCRIVPRWKELD